jgi:L-threonylcarbamoyladenylate synthase
MVLKAGSPESFASLSGALASGGIAIAPGDTMYGLIGIVPGAEARLRAVKGRGEDKPFLQIVPEASWIGRISDQSVPRKLQKYWPGPLTLVVRDRRGGTVAVRVPDSKFLQKLVSAVGVPLYSTSVNRAGSPPLRSVVEMVREFSDDVDAIFDDGDHEPGPPSTLLDITSVPYKVLRQGALRIDPADLL